MKFISVIAAAASICAASSTFASLITFEGIASQNPVTNQYLVSSGIVFSDAGALGNNSTATTNSNYDVQGFVQGATVLTPGDVANFSDTAVYAQGLSGTSFTLSAIGPVGAGSLEGPFSFLYSSNANVLVNVFDGVNSGPIQVFNLAANDAGTGATWTSFSVASLAAGAKIIEFGGAGGFALYDNIMVTAVPLPAALALFPFGAAALGAAARRRKAAAAV